MFRKVIIGASVLVELGLFGCGQAEVLSEEVASVESELNRTAALWLNGRVPVCYRVVSSPSTDETNRRISWFEQARHVVEDSWQRVAKIDFSGWGQCGSNVAGYLVVNLNNGGGSRSGVGAPGSGDAQSMDLDTSDTWAVTVMHEFGHALGFSHEFDRSDWTGNCMKCDAAKLCPSGDGKVCLPSGYCGHKHTINDAVTPSDADSIMAATYCGGWAEAHSELSPWDVIGAQRKYGRRHTGSIVGLNGRCLNVSGGTSESGKNLITYPCQTQSNDIWSRTYSLDNSALLEAKIQGQRLCANVSGGAVDPSGSTQLISWGCDGEPNERFMFDNLLWRAMGNMCIVASRAEANSALELQHCGDAPGRDRWEVMPSRIRLRGTNLCVAKPADAGIGTLPTLQSCGGNDLWDLRNGEIWDDARGLRCLNVFGGNPTPGSQIGLWNNCGRGEDNVYFYFSGPLTTMGQCMDIIGDPSRPSANVGVYPCHGGPNQQWDWHFGRN